MIFSNITDLDEFNILFLFNLLGLLNQMRNEELTLMPVFLYWIKTKLATCNVTQNLQERVEKIYFLPFLTQYFFTLKFFNTKKIQKAQIVLKILVLKIQKILC